YGEACRWNSPERLATACWSHAVHVATGSHYPDADDPCYARTRRPTSRERGQQLRATVSGGINGTALHAIRRAPIPPDRAARPSVDVDVTTESDQVSNGRKWMIATRIILESRYPKGSQRKSTSRRRGARENI